MCIPADQKHAIAVMMEMDRQYYGLAPTGAGSAHSYLPKPRPIFSPPAPRHVCTPAYPLLFSFLPLPSFTSPLRLPCYHECLLNSCIFSSLASPAQTHTAAGPIPAKERVNLHGWFPKACARQTAKEIDEEEEHEHAKKNQ